MRPVNLRLFRAFICIGAFLATATVPQCTGSSLALEAHLNKPVRSQAALQTVLSAAAPRSVKQWLWDTTGDLIGLVIQSHIRQERCLLFIRAVEGVATRNTTLLEDPCAWAVHRHVNWAVWLPKTRVVVASVWLPQPAVVVFALDSAVPDARVTRVYQNIDLSGIHAQNLLCVSQVRVEDGDAGVKDYLAFVAGKSAFGSPEPAGVSSPVVWIWVSDSATAMGPVFELPTSRTIGHFQRMACSTSVLWAVRSTSASRYYSVSSNTLQDPNVPMVFLLNRFLKDKLANGNGGSGADGLDYVWTRVLLAPPNSPAVGRIVYSSMTIQDMCVTSAGLGVALLETGEVLGFGCHHSYPSVFEPRTADSVSPCTAATVAYKTFLLTLGQPTSAKRVPVDGSRGISCHLDEARRVFRWAAFSNPGTAKPVVEWNSERRESLLKDFSIPLYISGSHGEQLATVSAAGTNSTQVAGGGGGGAGATSGIAGFLIYQGSNLQHPKYRTENGRVSSTLPRPGVDQDSALDGDLLLVAASSAVAATPVTPGDVSNYAITATGIVLGVALTLTFVIVAGLIIAFC